MRKLCASFALALLGVSAASAQLVSAGALGGVRLTNGFQSFNDESRIYDVGGSVEFRLPAGFAVEADALYQRIGYSYGLVSSAGAAPGGTLAFRERGNLWEFPLLGKYYFRPRSESWQPFVGIGPAFRTASLHSQESASILSGANESSVTSITMFRGDFRSDVQTGAAIAVGVRFKLGPVAFLPQARYTYWGHSNYGLMRNEATLLLGVNF